MFYEMEMMVLEFGITRLIEVFVINDDEYEQNEILILGG